MKKVELVLLPLPAVGHLISKLEFAKLLLSHSPQLHITILILQNPNRKLNFDRSIGGGSSNLSNRLKFIDLQFDPNFSEPIASNFIFSLLNSHKPKIKQILFDIIQSESILAGIVLDMFCSSMVEIANELNIPSYVYFTSGANFLTTLFHIQSIRDCENVDVLSLSSDTVLEVPGFVNEVPCGVLPSMVFNVETTEIFYQIARWVKGTNGIVINTFMEMENYAIESLRTQIPNLYPVGPLLNLEIISQDDDPKKNSEIMDWLNNQPPSSVVFLCFGSVGKVGEAQIKEIASALELSEHRFLWSLRVQPEESHVLPEGFLNRTAGIGKIIGWAPQAAVLAHAAIGGFVSHCGWNSILESIWFGIPIAAWAMYAEQHINSFMMVKEQGLAVEIKLDHGKDFTSQPVVNAETIERGIRGVMEINSEVRKKMKEMSEKSRKAIASGGSSHVMLEHFIEDVIKNAT